MSILKQLSHRFGFRSCLYIYTDGSIRPDMKASGMAAVVRDGSGKTLHWWSQRAGVLTNNEAEYAAAILALERVRRMLLPLHLGRTELVVFSDSKVMVDQMCGAATPHSPAMCRMHIQLKTLAGHFWKVSFRHIPREQNRLADALANEAAEGRRDE